MAVIMMIFVVVKNLGLVSMCTCVIMAALFSMFTVRSVLLTVRLVAMVKKHNDYNFCVMYDTPDYSQLLGFHKKYM